MIIINNKNYNIISKNVSFNKYQVTQNGKERKGISLHIVFKLNNILLGIETNYDKKWLENLNTNDRKDISKYVTDITYEDENGWISLITGNYKCYISKVKNNIFTFEINCEAEEGSEYYKILLNEELEMNYE